MLGGSLARGTDVLRCNVVMLYLSSAKQELLVDCWGKRYDEMNSLAACDLKAISRFMFSRCFCKKIRNAFLRKSFMNGHESHV